MYVSIEDDSQVTMRSNNGNDYYNQSAWFYRDGLKHPLPIELPVENPQGHQQGKYKLLESNYRPSKYGKLELNPFQCELTMFEDKDGKPMGKPK